MPGIKPGMTVERGGKAGAKMRRPIFSSPPTTVAATVTPPAMMMTVVVPVVLN
jgi:hypothetical protein